MLGSVGRKSEAVVLPFTKVTEFTMVALNTLKFDFVL
jgi:hypothetical protein